METAGNHNSSLPDPPEADLRAAEDLKQEGNDHFRAKCWDEALAAYRSALGHLPPRPKLDQSRKEPEEPEDTPAVVSDDEPESRADEPSKQISEKHVAQPGEEVPPSELDLECARARSILNANIGACYAKLGEHKEVVAACTEALKDDPKYIKALQRRAAANEQIGSWSSLSSAQEAVATDYKALLELFPPTSPDLVSTRRSLASLTPRVEAAQKHETAEMLDKLKGLGNSILGNFGLSTNNFQFTPNGQGGYSMNFVQDST